MTGNAEKSASNTSAYYPIYQTVFEAIDMAATFWQPLFKAIGRSQLEFAGMQARQARAVVKWGHEILQPASPLDIFNTNTQLWQAVTEQYVDVVPRVAAAVSTATQSVAPVVLPLPVKRSRDTLVLLDRNDDTDGEPERKVA